MTPWLELKLELELKPCGRMGLRRMCAIPGLWFHGTVANMIFTCSYNPDERDGASEAKGLSVGTATNPNQAEVGIHSLGR